MGESDGARASSELAPQLEEFRSRINALEATTKREIPWYKNFSSMIAVAALLFSFGTTYVSYRHTSLQDIQNRTIELRSLLQRLAALPKENLDFMKRYSGDAIGAGTVSGYINWENILLVRQAAEIVKHLPVDQLSSTEYQGIAVAMYNSRNNEQAELFYQKALESAESLDDEIGALRGKAIILFITGKQGEGRTEYQKALSIFDRRRGYDNFTQVTTNLLTELNWGFSEANSGFLDLARKHASNAERLVTSLPPSPGQEQFKGQVLQAKAQFGMQ